jgi:Fe-S cluster assembly ATPase SufC
MSVFNEEVVDFLKMKEGVLKRPTNSDFHGGERRCAKRGPQMVISMVVKEDVLKEAHK